MNNTKFNRTIFPFCLAAGAILINCLISNKVFAIEIERFEHLNSYDGLSQNSVLSIFCDHKGFMWLGTMDGLNRYDGYTFKIFKAQPGIHHTLTNNRVSNIWEDERKFLWIATYDGYVHWYNPAREEFNTIPFFYRSDEEKNSSFTCFFQESKDEVWIGTSNSGIYYLQFDSLQNNYTVLQYLSRGVNSITNNEIHFIRSDAVGNVWIGTQQGLNKLDNTKKNTDNFRFQHYQIQMNFTSSAVTDEFIWFGTRNQGIIAFNCASDHFVDIPEELRFLSNQAITLLKESKDGLLIIGTRDMGLFIYDENIHSVKSFEVKGNRITNVYEDSFGVLWINSEVFGVTRINLTTETSKYFILTPKEIESLVDEERQYFFEDSQRNLWIGLHGAGLAYYNRDEDRFDFFRNIPNEPLTISSNFVHCITEDKSGILWLGTGQINGGINKVIPANPSFKHILPRKNTEDMSDNAIRCVFEDRNGSVWMASKSGTIYIYDQNFSLQYTLNELPLENTKLPGYNIYTIHQDSEGYLWLGSKGGGVAISTQPLQKSGRNYSKIKFRIYQHHPKIKSSISSNNIYSIIEDTEKRIWIGTYGGGLDLVLNLTDDSLICRRINRSNSNLSADEIRNVFQDSQGRLWIATVFGLNLLENYDQDIDSIIFRVFHYNPQSREAISYNDVVHIFEDTKKRLWFSTFGGGINLLTNLDKKEAEFLHYTNADGLVNDAVCGILEDTEGYLWFSTEGGISRFNPEEEIFENYDKNNGLQSDRFSENTCFSLKNGRLMFGSTNGVLVIHPEIITKKPYIPPIVFTNFQLFNKDVDFHDKDAPFNCSIEYLDEITLKYFQSSFSIEYAALSFFDPHKNSYQYKLVGFEDDWNEVGNLNRATYTNLSPGKYEFQVKAASWDGTWNPTPRKIKVTILPPWYRTWWAYISYLIFLIIAFEISRRIFTKYYHMRNDLRVERRVNEIKLQFFTNVSHEIRTPLTLILGPLNDIKANTKLSSSLRRSIDIMDRNGKRMLRLVNQLLDFRKIQKNKMRLIISETEIVQFVKEVCENFYQIAHQKQIHFKFQSEIEHLTIWVDQDKFDSVLFNILSNAFKFTESGKSIGVRIMSPDDGYLKIQFQDEGKGISKDKIPVLFQRYTPLSGSDVNYQGTGIGLALSYEIMKLHHGELEVESVVNAGSLFTLKIKLGKDHFQKDEYIDLASGSGETWHRKIEEEGEQSDDTFEKSEQVYDNTILLVEDNEEIIEYIQHILETKYHMIVAKNGTEGLDRIKKTHPDLIITDIMMPGMDGIEMTRKVKENFETSHIPIVMLTAKSHMEIQIQGIETGAEAYILKPFNAEYLKAVIANILKQREIVIKKFRDKNEIELDTLKLSTKDEVFLNEIVRLIEENYSDPAFNVEKLVEKSTVGRTVFYNKVKGLTGLSPVEFLRQIRLKIASTLLIKSGYNVSEVGYMSGFNDIKYFSKCFKTQYGMTPSEYKNQYANS